MAQTTNELTVLNNKQFQNGMETAFLQSSKRNHVENKTYRIK